MRDGAGLLQIWISGEAGAKETTPVELNGCRSAGLRKVAAWVWVSGVGDGERGLWIRARNRGGGDFCRFGDRGDVHSDDGCD
ncbi:hypothetical protein M0R45_006473 [Rubus argutus]|uniref:Uncharacterized protein n=1 Tax=Rubus argutus TaxID=59490 RepID=A0AAW1VWY9_RUBAR